MSPRTADFDYPLPEEAIAQQPPRRRDACRLAVFRRGQARLTHHRFRDLPQLLEPGDLLVFNDTRVIPARVPCRRKSGGAAEVFLLDPPGPGELQALVRPAAKLKPGELLAAQRGPGSFLYMGPAAEGQARVRWAGPGAFTTARLRRLGLTPTPPYVRRVALPPAGQRQRDQRGYQTVFARRDGSVAAPTAGLHFTRRLLRALTERGVRQARVTLHVGAGTFQPVKSERLEDHPMHAELYQVRPECMRAVAQALAQGKRVIAVGTTALRALESAARAQPSGFTDWKETRLFLMPGDAFKLCTGLVTNFHQPRSTLLPLVGAFHGEPRTVLDGYAACLAKGYRFLSYGDACLFL